jgi:hypothetical protein
MTVIADQLHGQGGKGKGRLSRHDSFAKGTVAPEPRIEVP